MTPHRFSIGQIVRLTSGAIFSPQAASTTYTIEAPLPPYGNSPQYRLRCEQSSEERVAQEQHLERVIRT